MTPQTIPLVTPVSVGGTAYKELTVQRPMKVRDQLAAARQTPLQEEREVLILSWLCGVPRDVIEELEMPDYGQLQRVLMGFTPLPAASPAPTTSAQP